MAKTMVCWTCDICNTLFETKDEAEFCETTHKLVSDIKENTLNLDIVEIPLGDVVLAEDSDTKLSLGHLPNMEKDVFSLAMIDESGFISIAFSKELWTKIKELGDNYIYSMNNDINA